MYDIAENGTATPLSINLSPTEGDGPRNSYPSKDGKLLYVVSEPVSPLNEDKLTKRPQMTEHSE